MAMNPSKMGESATSPIERANALNDPQFENQEGYYPYDETHQEFLTPLYGLITPSMHFDTIPGDRLVHKDNCKTILNQIDGNLLSTVNQYVDCFYVPMRSLYPNNYEKFTTNPTKGSDLPNSALPQCPLAAIISRYFDLSEERFEYTIRVGDYDFVDYSDLYTITNWYLYEVDGSIETGEVASIAISRLLYMSTILSRGQLLDYLGVQYDYNFNLGYSQLQQLIDDFHRKVYLYLVSIDRTSVRQIELDLISDVLDVNTAADYEIFQTDTLSKYRDALLRIYERGRLPYFGNFDTRDTEEYQDMVDAYRVLLTEISLIFAGDIGESLPPSVIDIDSDPFQNGCISLLKPLAYQQIVAQYYTNDAVDNIFNSDLFMQLLRSVMFPSDNGFSNEPTFLFNGVTTEYDYISYGSIWYSLLYYDRPGSINRIHVWMSLMFLLRQSLRYGDYFATARPNMLAVGQLSINVTDEQVSPIDITRNLLMQRYLNAANYIGSGFLAYFQSIFGVRPSDTGTFPRFIAHRKIELGSDIVTNTADDQGKQSTNLVGYSDDQAFDVFIDDFGVVLSLVSYDTLPIYRSGIDATNHLADRFDFFNPMLQNIGDQPIRLSELIGNPALRTTVFGYTMRNGEYKYKISRAHGAFVNSLKGFLIPYQYDSFDFDSGTLHIDPEFIRERPVVLDSIVPQMTGISPGEYFHFAVAVTNQLQCARKMQMQPPILF